MIDLKAQAELEIGEDSDKDKKANEAARKEWNTKRILTLPFTLVNSQPYVQVGDGPQQNRQWQVRSIAFGNQNTPNIIDTSYGEGTVTAPSTNQLLFSGGSFLYNQTPGYFNVSVTVGFGSAAGTVYGNFKVYWGNSISTQEILYAPLTAYATQTYNFIMYIPTSSNFVVRVPTADTGVYTAWAELTPLGNGPMYLYSDTSLSPNSLKWVVDSTPSAHKFGHDEFTLIYPQKLIITNAGQYGTIQYNELMSGTVQITDLPQYGKEK